MKGLFFKVLGLCVKVSWIGCLGLLLYWDYHFILWLAENYNSQPLDWLDKNLVRISLMCLLNYAGFKLYTWPVIDAGGTSLASDTGDLIEKLRSMETLPKLILFVGIVASTWFWGQLVWYRKAVYFSVEPQKFKEWDAYWSLVFYTTFFVAFLSYWLLFHPKEKKLFITWLNESPESRRRRRKESSKVDSESDNKTS